MTTDRERKERKESLKELFLLLHNCAAEYQSQDIAKIHYSHLARAAGEINALLYATWCCAESYGKQLKFWRASHDHDH